MDNCHFPKHWLHLDPTNNLIIAIIGKDKADAKAICYPCEYHGPTEVTVFIDRPVSHKALSEMEM